MPENRKHLSVRLDGELHDKFQYVAQYEGRSMSRQIVSMVAACVREFEKEHGEISRKDMGAAKSS